MPDRGKPDFRIVGGHVALNLVNTVAPRAPGGGERVEFLPEPADLLGWARDIRLIDAAEADEVRRAWRENPVAAGQAWHATVEIREAAYAVLAAALDPTAAAPGLDLERLTLRWTAAAGRSELVWTSSPGATALPGHPDTTPPTVRLSVGTVPASRIPDRLAAAVVSFIQAVDLNRLHSCPIDDGGCGWLFLDTSRNGSRRWCAMDDCGSRAKARRLTNRRRASRYLHKHSER